MRKLLLGLGLMIILISFVSAESYRTVYEENFDSDPNWDVSHPSLTYYTTFQGDGVYRVQPTYPETVTATTPLIYGNDAFKLEWDSYIQEPSIKPTEYINHNKVYRFGIFDEYYWKSGSFGEYAIRHGDANDEYNARSTLYTSSGVEFSWFPPWSFQNGFENQWFHNVLVYDKSGGGISSQPIIKYTVYEGKQNTTNEVGETFLFTTRFNEEFGGSDRLGFIGSTLFGAVDEPPEYPIMYLDNILFSTLVFDTDGDGILDDEDKCPNTTTEQIAYGCNCLQILELKGMDNKDECNKGIIDNFIELKGWAKDIFN